MTERLNWAELIAKSIHIRLLSFECVCVFVCAHICVNSHQPKRATLTSHLLPGGDPHLTPELPRRSAKVFCCDCSTVHLLPLLNPSFFISYSRWSDDTPPLLNSLYAKPHLSLSLGPRIVGSRTGLTKLTQKWILELDYPQSGFPGASVVKNLSAMQEPQETRVRSLGQEDPLEEGMATHCSILAWRIPWTEEPGTVHSPQGCEELDMTDVTWHAHISLVFGCKIKMNCACTTALL